MRLTRRGNAGNALKNCEDCEIKLREGCCSKQLCLNALISKLAAYEDAEEQGRLVILPCKVGDMAYVIWDSSIYPDNPPGVREDHITQVKFTKKGYAFKTWRGWYHKSDIGKTVFLIREEAEVALKGGQDDV